MIHVLGIDPGNTTGWSRFHYDKEADNLIPLAFGETKHEEFFDWLESQRVDVIVCEDYIILPPNKTRGGFVHAWDKGVTSKMIGAIKYHAYLHGITVVMQRPVEKPTGYTLMGKEYKKGKAKMHIWDSVAHVHVWRAKEQRKA